ncbi:MAG: nitrogenase component 1, partial [Methanoregula sp.]|nr:nitrogenase component 1 [Methanoregula sp.]
SPLKNRRIALVSGPTRAISMTRFFAELGIEPRLVVVDFHSTMNDRLDSLALKTGEVLIEPEQELILQKLREHHIDLLIGGMLELPLAKTLGIDHIDIMHGSERTVGFAGAKNLLRLLVRKNAGK